MGDLIDRIAADQWTAPTPWTEGNARDLVSHLVGVNLMLVAMFEESPMPERAVDRLGADAGLAGRACALEGLPRLGEASPTPDTGHSTS